MAAEIQPERGNTRKPQLVNKIETSIHSVNELKLIPEENGIITVSDDSTVRVWLKRDTGQYWPSICQTMPSMVSCLDYDLETKHILIGLDNGNIAEYKVAEDYNRMTHVRDYVAHRGRLSSVRLCPTQDWVLSCAQDKWFQWHCAQTGSRLGGHVVKAWCTALAYDSLSSYVFVGDYSGKIHVLKISAGDKVQVITVLKGHSGSIRCLAWDADKSHLFSGSFDKSVVVWDIGGQKGTAYELHGHHDKVQALVHVSGSAQLLTSGSDTLVALWDLATQRTETPEWQEGDSCEHCAGPFFWNFRSMWEKKTVGVRQHHCRKCGKAVCAKCSDHQSTIPRLGYEYPVRVCKECYPSITDQDRAPLATFHDIKHQVISMDLDIRKKLLVTAGTDRLIKIWDVSSVLH